MPDKKSGGKSRVAVYGAAGHTGRFVVSELLRRGMTPVAAGRDTSRLLATGLEDSGVELRGASIDDPASLDQAFVDVAMVINCAGPFLDTAETVAAAALRAGAHYLDVTAEQASATATLEHFAEPARRAGLLVMPAMGFFGGLADLLVTAAAGDWESVDDVAIGIALDSWHPTQGTRLTGARNTAQRLMVTGGALAPLALPAATRAWDFPPPFARQEMVEMPLSEVVLVARHLRTRELHTYLSAAALNDIRDPATPPPQPVDAHGRSAQRFLVEAIVQKGGLERRARVGGRDIYAFSAPLVCEAAERILDHRTTARGAFAPGAAFDAASFLGAIAPDAFTTEARGA
ncbi:MAG: saccharopine dehydrogenase NADP-binding domain-containing protein [Sphingomonas sp.]|uniref:saccharopine dehydrogenase family protein n=1 Tax=Sphingomonas sp. TaxID=28214 RepID=UPI001B0D9770|nr:saccharopine dehydrogenase NADP-binding domain-containing protein [Sphingomonas sp.]MBO9621565.1 saccharopine dehydrogenase NADP-binding domain-containing protein [Sphingomonas sp.]